MRALRHAFPVLLLFPLSCANAPSEENAAAAEAARLEAAQQRLEELAATEVVQEPAGDRYEIPMEGEDEGFDQETLDARVAAIVPRVAELRGLEWRHEVPAGVHTPEQFVAFAKGAVAEEYPDGALGRMGAAFGLFGLIPREMDIEAAMFDMLESMVGGYYDPATKTFYMISTFNSGALADYIMAHELGHALDDQHYPLDAYLEAAGDNSDRQWAATSVVEGSASAVGNMYLLRGIAEGWMEGEMNFGSMLGMLDDIQRVPPYLIISMTLPYTIGNAFLVRETNVMAGMLKPPTQEDLVRVFTDPPTSSEQILHPEKYWDAEQFDAPSEVVLADRSVELGDGWSSPYDDTLGELGCAVLVMPRVPTPVEVSAGGGTWVHEASAGWDGDRFRLYLHDEHGAAMEWRTVWDSEQDAEEFEAALQDVTLARAPLLRTVHRDGTTVRVVFADAGATEAAAKLATVR